MNGFGSVVSAIASASHLMSKTLICDYSEGSCANDGFCGEQSGAVVDQQCLFIHRSGVQGFFDSRIQRSKVIFHNLVKIHNVHVIVIDDFYCGGFFLPKNRSATKIRFDVNTMRRNAFDNFRSEILLASVIANGCLHRNEV